MSKITNVSKVYSTITLPHGKKIVNKTLSNEATVTNMSDELLIVRSLHRTKCLPGDVLKMTVFIKNRHNETIRNIRYYDIISGDAKCINETVKINYIPHPELDPQDMVLPIELEPNASATVTYNVVASKSPKKNHANCDANFEYTVSDVILARALDTLEIEILKNNVRIEKSADKKYVHHGDQIQYTIIITNLGIVPINEIRFVDPIPNKTNFVEGSVTVNGIIMATFNPVAGFPLPPLPPKASHTVTFKVSI